MCWLYLSNVPSRSTDVAFHKDGKLKRSGFPLVEMTILPPVLHSVLDTRDDKSGIDMLADASQ